MPCTGPAASYNAPVIRSASWVLFCACLGSLVGACGKDEELKPDRISDDEAREAEAGVERDSGRPPPETFDVGESQVLESLQDPETRQALCSALGIVVSGQAGAQGPSCQAIADSCNSQPLPLDTDAGLVLPDDLSAALQCPITTTEVDRCLSDLMSALSDVSCASDGDAGSNTNGSADGGSADGGSTNGSDTGELLDPAVLLGTVSCFPVFIKCPDLVNALMQALQASQAPEEASTSAAAQARSAR